MKKFATLCLIPACFSLASANAEVVALYDFEAGGSGNSLSNQAGLFSVDTQANTTASVLTSGGPEGLNGGGAGNIFNNAQGGSSSGPPLSNWGNGNNGEGSANYAEFTVTPDVDYEVTYESLSLYHGSFNATGQVKITYAIGAGAEVTALAPLSHTAANTDLLTLKTEDFGDFTTSEVVTWRIYVFGTDAPNTGTRLDDITINGTVALVPEPSALALLGLGGLLIARRRRLF